MTANDIRSKFLKFFASKQHTVVESDTLVPKEDPTVLFTTAGMQQFKRQFLGHIEGYTRAATCQKCLRTDDLDEVGQTAYHHTFFEMLGNFSFGDYFKKEAICWGWEFLTKELGLPEDKLWVSVYQDDKEAEAIWLKDVGLPKKRLVRLGEKSNFWPSEAQTKGPNGPCGPCSEIFYDYGPQDHCQNKDCNPDCDCGRFCEVWNLVFTQYNRKDGGELEPLPGKNIDTGMGLERLVAVIQGKKNNFDTDLFQPIITAIESHIDKGKLGLSLTEKRIIADHIRSVVIGINDGVIPSNKERGSVIKRLINDSTNIMLTQGAKEAHVYQLVPAVIEIFADPYPELKKKAKNISELIRKTEEAFIKVRKQRIPEFKKRIATTQDTAELGQLFFEYRDTYGLPLNTIIETAQEADVTEKDLKDILKIYQQKMTEQQERSRAGSKMAGDVFTDTNLNLDVPKTKFLGYESFGGEGRILKILTEQGETDSASKGEPLQIILDQTPFYAESGGQTGDSGTIQTKTGHIKVTGTQKKDDIFIHNGEVIDGNVKKSEKVTTKIDQERRLSIMRNHTATHILQAALRTVLGEHVQQQGSLVAEDRLRFDFTHPKAITGKEIRAIEDYVNTCVLACDTVKKETLPIEEARKRGALAFFAEKYGKTVRVVSIDDYSTEFCGGTHLDSTGQIGLFKITSESAIAQGIRRLEARTGTGALDYLYSLDQELNKISALVKSKPEDAADRIGRQVKRVKALEKELEKFRTASITNQIDDLIKGAAKAGSAKVIAHSFNDADMTILRKVADMIRQKAAPCVIILGAKSEDNAHLLVSVSDDLVKKQIRADQLIKDVSPIINGSGGGRPSLAQAGSKEPGKLYSAVNQARDLIIQSLKDI